MERNPANSLGAALKEEELIESIYKGILILSIIRPQ
jgi:hypothetical protein